jgi:hypothetical protein
LGLIRRSTYIYLVILPASPTSTSLTAAYTTFWDWFTQHERTYFQAVQEGTHIQEAFFDDLSPALDAVKEGLYFQTGMADEHTAELIISAEGAIENIVFAEELIAAAPTLTGWKFTALKEATVDIEQIVIHMADYKFSASNIHFYPDDEAAYPDEIAITVTHTALTEENHATVENGTLIFLDTYLGELALATLVDQVTIVSEFQAQQPLVPITKLRDFLTWRQKEFVEKYAGLRHETDNDTYAGFTAERASGQQLIAIMNTDLLEWDAKASHPWVMVVTIPFDGTKRNGMPDSETYELLNQLEEELIAELPDYEGYLNVGRQTADSSREIYFACQEFRKPSKVLYQFQTRYAQTLALEYSVYKDKYWQTFERFSG